MVHTPGHGPTPPQSPNPPQGGGGMSLEDLLKLLSAPQPMSEYQKAQIAATLRGQDITARGQSIDAATAAAGQQIQAAVAAANQARMEAQTANDAGNLELARQKNDEANYWEGVAAEANAQAGARGEVGLATNAFGAQSEDMARRASAHTAAGNLYGSLANTVGNLSEAQARLGLDILTRPRNAVAGFLMGLGDSPAAQQLGANFNLKSILGVDPQSLNQYLQMAVQAGQQAQAQAASPQQINLSDFLANIDARAKAISAGQTGGFGVPRPGSLGATPGAPPTSTPNLLDRPGTPRFVTDPNYVDPAWSRPLPGTVTLPGSTIQDVTPGVSYIPPAPSMPAAPMEPEPDRGGFVSQPPGAPMPSLLDQVNAILGGGMGGGGAFYGPQGTPVGQEAWGTDVMNELMRQFRGGR